MVLYLTNFPIAKEVQLCQPKGLLGCTAGDTDDDNESDIGDLSSGRGTRPTNDEKDELSFFSNPLTVKPMYAMTTWRHPKTRDGRLAVLIVLPTGAIEREDGIKAELVTSEQLQISLSWPPALLDADGIMKALLSFCNDLEDGQGPLLAQGLRDFTDPLHSEASQDVVSSCNIQLPFPVKPDFEEDVMKFDGNDSTTIYVIRFHAFEQRFATPKKRLMVRNINLGTVEKGSESVNSGGAEGAVSESKSNKENITSAVTMDLQ